MKLNLKMAVGKQQLIAELNNAAKVWLRCCLHHSNDPRRPHDLQP